MLRAVQRRLSPLRMSSQHPLIAIVGATGTGKSQLAVSLAKHFNGEIINGDALQMYEGLPVITNKIPFEERESIRHHLLGCIKPEEEPWTVKHFIDRACKIVEEIRSRDKVPILVGGTHYYTQSLLFRNAVVDDKPGDLAEQKQEQTWPILDASTGDILQELYRVDPAMAARWHPNDRRKIRRSLEIYLTTGKKASEFYKQQGGARVGTHGSDSLGGLDVGMCRSMESGPPLRYNTLIFWIHAAAEALNARLGNRVDTMVSKGLLEEAGYMHDAFENQERQGRNIERDRGIRTAIGFKELRPYVVDKDRSEHIKQECIERIKIATRQYAKRQVRWIRLRLHRALITARSSHDMFLLDGSDLSQWSQAVGAKASEITAGFLGGNTISQPSSLSAVAMEITTEAVARSARVCEVCNKTLMSEMEWSGHLKSRGHRSAVKPKVDWEKLYPKKKPHKSHQLEAT